MPELYIGLMSGTSMDGIDAVLVDLDGKSPRIINALNHPWPDDLKSQLRHAAQGATLSMDDVARLDAEVGVMFAEAALHVLSSHADPKQVRAIGSHGQTLAHNPDALVGYSLQIGNPNYIAEKTGIATVADFRGRDIAAHGQGAPLVPAFHQAVFQHPGENRVILNIGGIANLTWLPADVSEPISGFDAGPGNCLLDSWVLKYRNQSYDKDGAFAHQGKLQAVLLAALLNDDYFSAKPPKSTGTDYFSLAWLQGVLKNALYTPEDVQATLIHLTVQSIMQSIHQHYPITDRVLLCGGGMHNSVLVQALVKCLDCPLESTENHGLHPDWVEAVAFAWLAQQHIRGLPGNIAEVSGADGLRILGAFYPV